MRLLKISQTIIFKEDTFSGVFKKGQKVTFSGYLDSFSDETFTGYMKQEPFDDATSITLCVKGYLNTFSGNELVLVQTTERDSVPITMCSYFPRIRNNVGTGYLDDTNGITTKEGKYFFMCGDYIANTDITLEGFEEVNPQDNIIPASTERRLKRMYRKLNYSDYVTKNLNFGFLFDYIKPHWCGADKKLIHIYPN